jgi:hypothetical protein
MLERRRRWWPGLAKRLVAHLGEARRPKADDVAEFLVRDAAYQRALKRGETVVSALAALWHAPVMWPAAGAPRSWCVPEITTPAGLARFVEVTQAQLEWLADRQARERRTREESARRYSYHWVAKRSGGSRLIEIPLPRLRALQRRVHREILQRIPPHSAAYGFRRGCSIRSFAEPHVGRPVVLRMDLKDFFATIHAARVTALFLEVGYPEAVARLLAGLSTNSAPSSLWNSDAARPWTREAWQARRLYQQPHLPQGAPTSPALANLCAYRLDARLAGLAAAAGGCYTRYADDLAFSGGTGFARSIERFLVHASAVVLEEGFRVHPRKTRVMRSPADRRSGREREA